MEPISPTNARTGHSHTPVLSHSRVSSPVQSDFGESIPPTMNELDAQEKARLLKKHRKLSKVFGKVPDFQRPSLYMRSRNSISNLSHRRSASVRTNDSSSSRGRTARKIASHSDLGSVSDGGSQLDEPKYESPIPPMPPLAFSRSRGSTDAFSEPTSFQHRKKSSLHILTPPKLLSDDDDVLKPPSSPTLKGLPEDVRMKRMLKLRRFLGDQSNSSSHTLKTRTSYDSSMVKQLREAPHTKYLQDNPIHRSRSLTPYKRELEQIDSAVDFHRQYVHIFGRVTHRSAAETHGSSASSSTSSSSVSQAQRPSRHPESRQTSMAAVRHSATAPNMASDVKIPESPSTNSVTSVESFLDSAFDERFRDRRRRAAKLTQFFGVQYQDITASLTGVSDELPDIPSRTPVQVDVRPEPTVDVRTNTRRFWGFSGDNLKEAEVSDVIGKLRELRAP
ncbi:hypothetical protein D9757_006389 [Collybiopsis confluens]|uniref:Uncharacterized protein n=1 Tax=Collybiopsis confluens TaxID=2823264 RepID=A0A8H5M6W1_9AGAR|nr:hypothetical protein D9757_006389 [Collybiopsis confluens]